MCLNAFLVAFWNMSLQELIGPGEACPGVTENITQYQISFQSGSVVATENVNIARCTAGKCSHTFELPSNPPSSYDSVLVAAENVVGVGAARTCTTQPISECMTGLPVQITNIYCIRVSSYAFVGRCRYTSHCGRAHVNGPLFSHSWLV